MLAELHIRNIAIIDHLDLVFEPGFTAITGETGAGKSILISALNLLLGGRASTDLIRSGCSEAVAEALFLLEGDPATSARLRELGLEDGDQLVIQRVVTHARRNTVRINGHIATLAGLREIAGALVDISGQHEHQTLLRPETHTDLLDAFGGLEVERGQVHQAYEAYRQLVAERDGLLEAAREKRRREDYLRYQLDEIEKLDPQPGEDEQLEAERAVLVHAERLANAAREGEEILYGGEGAAVELLGRVQNNVQEMARVDERTRPLVDYLEQAQALLEEVARELRRYGEEVEVDGSRLEEVDDRLEQLRRLVRKHGTSLEDVLTARQEMAGELDDLVHDEARLAELDGQVARAAAELQSRARTLSERRATAAREFGRVVEQELGNLSLAGTSFAARIEPLGGRSADESLTVEGGVVGPRGAEKVEFLLAPNAGESLRPLARIASGGELSRVMLAIKRVLAARDPVATYVFDEVDSGVGGAVAEVIGRALQAVSREHQVICITHLPQIASLADYHYVVSKEEQDGRTFSTVDLLAPEQREMEIARMLGGLEITDKTREHAREMLVAAASPAEGARRKSRQRAS